MAWLSESWRRLRALLQRKQLDADLEEEMRLHVELRAQEQIHAGVLPGQAAHVARRRFGNQMLLREVSREVWGWGPVERLWQDLRYGLRMLVRNPSFTLIAVLTLGAGIGVNTAVFTAFNAVALRPLDVPAPDRVVQVDRSTQAGFFSYPDYVYLRDNSQSFSALAAAGFFRFSMTGAPPMSASAQSGITNAAGFTFPQMVYARDAEPVAGMLVSGNYFRALGVEPILGRGFIPEEDDKPGARPVLLISDNYWERRFARNPKLLGATLVMNGIRFTVIGITPRDFTGTAPIVPAGWAPLATRTLLEPGADILRDRTVTCCRLYGRLRSDATRQQADAQMRALFSRLQQIYPDKDSHEKSKIDHLVVTAASPFGPPDEGLMGIAAFVLTAVSMVLLIACANVAGLLLARSAARQKEIAVRLAIGASRGRLIRQLLTESALISILAGVTGLVLAWWTLHLLMMQISASLPVFWVAIALHLAPDHRVFAYMLLLSFMAAIAFGLAPALQASRPNLTSALKEEGAAFGLRVRKSNLRDILIGLQVAVSLVLLIGAGLLARGSERAFGIDLGFDYRHMISMDVHVSGVKYDASRMIAIRRQLLLRIEGLPGVKSVSVASRAPLAGGNRTLSIGLEGNPPNSEHAPEGYDDLVTRDYFETVGIPILHGRNFTEQEMRDGADFDGVPVILSAATAQKFWPGQNAIGKHISFAHPTGAFEWDGEVRPQSRSSVVIGVTKDIRSLVLERLDETCVYLPVSRNFNGSMVVRTEGDPKTVVAALRTELQAIDSNLEVFILDFRSVFSQQPAFVLSRIGAIGSTIIGVLGLLLAAVGIYGMVSFAVSQRTHEIGVRMALGALRSDVLGLVLRQSMRPVMIGVAVGLALAVAVSHVLTAFLFGLSAMDPMTFLGVSAFLMAVAVLAGYVPARRAANVDPMVALRYE
jgi:macrolide transport system ATP-binding/permease protein